MFEHFGVYSANPNAESDVDVGSEGVVNVANGIVNDVSSSSFPEAGSNIVGLGKV